MEKRILIIGIILLIFSTMLNGQVRNSYYKKMESVNKNSSINSYLDSSDYYIDKNRDKAFDYLEKAWVLSLKANQSAQQRIVLRKLGDFYAHYNQSALAAQNYVRSLSNGSRGDVNFYNIAIKAGQQYLLADDPKESISIINKYYNQSKSSLYQMYMDIILGDAYFKQNNIEEALKAYRLAETKSSILGLTDQNTEIKIKIARILSSTEKSDDALVVLNQAKNQSYSNENTTLQVESEIEIANYYRDNNEPVKEIEFRKNAINILDSNETELESLNVDVAGSMLSEKVNLAITYNNLSQYDDAIKVLTSAVTTSSKESTVDNKKEGIRITDTDERTLLEQKKEAAKTLSTSYLMIGQKQKALDYYKKYVALSEELFKQKEIEYRDINQANRRLRDYQWQIEFLEKDKTLYDSEIQMVKQDRRLQKEKVRFQLWFIILLFIITILLIVALMMMRKRAKLQKQHNLLLDLKARRAQMNPHFIFNALNSINSFIARNDQLNANKYLSRFSKLMRSVLDNSDLDFIPLTNETEMLKLYMELEKMRFSDKFDYEISIDENINQSDFNIPPMLIQPFVENAVWHGLRYMESGGYLKVNFTKEDNYLKVIVEDNGIGIKKSEELKTKNQNLKKSTGIKNTRERLDILSKLYHKEFKSKISDATGDGEGVVVELWIPNIKETL